MAVFTFKQFLRNFSPGHFFYVGSDMLSGDNLTITLDSGAMLTLIDWS